MAHTHEFDCKTCGAHLDSREELERHSRANHGSSMQAGQATNQPETRQASPSNPPGDQRR
jgi:hypothetical protein